MNVGYVVALGLFMQAAMHNDSWSFGFAVIAAGLGGLIQIFQERK